MILILIFKMFLLQWIISGFIHTEDVQDHIGFVSPIKIFCCSIGHNLNLGIK